MWWLLMLGCESVDPSLLPEGELPPPMRLDADVAAPGRAMRLLVEGAPPGSMVTVLEGQPGVSCPAFASDCLDLIPPYRTVGQARANATGRAVMAWSLPLGVPRGQHLFLQAVTQPANLSKSNVLTRVIGQQCRYGDLLAESPPLGLIADQDRIYDDGSSLYVSSGTDLHQFDFDLVPTGQVAPLPVAGNHGFSYDRQNDVVFAYSLASQPGTAYVFNHDGSRQLAGPINTLSNTGGGAVDDQGHLHVVERISPGIVEIDPRGGVTGTWGTAVSSGQDLEVSPDGSTLFHFAWTVLSRFDLTDPARPLLGAVTLTTPRQGGFYYDEALDRGGNLYAVDRQAPGLEVWDPDSGLMLASMNLPAASDPAAVHYIPGEHAVYVAFYNGGRGIVRKYCAL